MPRPHTRYSPCRHLEDCPALDEGCNVCLGDGFLDLLQRLQLKLNPLWGAFEQLGCQSLLDGELHGGSPSLLLNSFSEELVSLLFFFLFLLLRAAWFFFFFLWLFFFLGCLHFLLRCFALRHLL